MIRVSAESYVRIGRAIQAVISHYEVVTKTNDAIGDDNVQIIREYFRSIFNETYLLKLDVTAEIAKQLHDKISAQTTYGAAKDEFTNLGQVLHAELKNRVFFHIPAHRAMRYFEMSPVTREVVKKFPSVEFDVQEAGKCFACERYTASIHHLMRVAEVGLVCFANFCEIQKEHVTNWNKALNLIDAAIREKRGVNLARMSKADEQYCTEASAWLRNVKTAWRNPASHIPMIYTEEKADQIFSAVISLMSHLSQKFSEPSATLSEGAGSTKSPSAAPARED